MANAVGTRSRSARGKQFHSSGPYSDRQWCVDRYDAAARKYRRKPAEKLAWGTKLEYPGVMDLIEVDDVIERLHAFSAHLDATAGNELNEMQPAGQDWMACSNSVLQDAA